MSSQILFFIAIAGIPIWLFLISKADQRIREWSPRLFAWSRKSIVHSMISLAGCLVSFPIGCVILMLAIFVMRVPFNNLTLDWYDQVFRQIPHPLNTSLISSRRMIHSPVNGECGFFIGELRKYSGSRQEVEEFYSGQAAHNPLFEKITIVFIESPNDFSDALSRYYGARELFDWQATLPDLESCYLIYFHDTGSDLFDYRCM